ncbi:helix-turn-helix transcriptional regulator [Pseudoclavibacter alba]|uniref:helix-turn-helix domain-containing protein n=1 Tax=Pseudoclavibacter albus TaxID=272241 RepID=UPI0019D24439|nr:helix-turn-helix transcriptional regulator [Pseudoclavibacter alba]MBN6777398.1 helix-turn-helix transcriptional regulator [Pseudoclavibacter alba]
MSNAGSLNARVLEAINALIRERKLMKKSVIAESGIPQNTYFRKMRGETPFTTDDIERIAHALGVTPETIMVRASTKDVHEPDTPPAPPISLDEHRNVLDVSDIADKLGSLPHAALEDETDPSMMLDDSESEHTDDAGFSSDNNEEGA